MARDGIAYYNVAVKLMETPEYQEKYKGLVGDDRIVLGHFSRKVLAFAQENKKNEELFVRYTKEELKLEDGDRCIFVDVGFSGSLVEPLNKLIPNVDKVFHFLIATTNKVRGFISNPEHPLPHFETPSNGHLAMRWLEETHHGTIASSKELVEVVGKEGRRIYPNSVHEQTLDNKKFSTEYFIQKFCSERLVEAAVEMGELTEEQRIAARARLSQVICAVKTQQLPLFVGWDR